MRLRWPTSIPAGILVMILPDYRPAKFTYLAAPTLRYRYSACRLTPASRAISDTVIFALVVSLLRLPEGSG